MPRLNAVDPAQASGDVREIFDGPLKGKHFNIFRHMGNSPAALNAYLGIAGALSKATLSAKEQEVVHLAVGQENGCDYCLAAHTAIGKGAGVSGDELAKNLKGEASDAKTQAALDFARAVVAKRGFVEDSDFASVREAGFNDGEILEIITVVVANILTNYLNHAIETEIDFPKVELDQTVGV